MTPFHLPDIVHSKNRGYWNPVHYSKSMFQRMTLTTTKIAMMTTDSLYCYHEPNSALSFYKKLGEKCKYFSHSYRSKNRLDEVSYILSFMSS